jgi:hypothetical protein
VLKREEWLDLARELDWEPSYVTEEELFPPEIAGRPWLSRRDWAGCARSPQHGGAGGADRARPLRRGGGEAVMWRRVTALDDLWSGEMRATRIGGRPVLLVNVGGRVRAFEDRCAHQGVPLSQGAASRRRPHLRGPRVAIRRRHRALPQPLPRRAQGVSRRGP